MCKRGIIAVDQCIEDYGNGINYNRKKWNELLDEVMKQRIKKHNRNPKRQTYQVWLCLF